MKRIVVIKRHEEPLMEPWNRYISYSESINIKHTLMDRNVSRDSSHMWGFIYGLKADFITTREINKIGSYDIVVTVDDILKEKQRQDQFYCFIKPEPINWGNSNNYTDKFHALSEWGTKRVEISDMYKPIINKPYDAILNSYILEDPNNERNIPCWWHFLVDEMQLLKKDKQPNKIHVSERTIRFHMNGQSLDKSFSYLFDEPRWFSSLFREWYGELSTCTYAINLCDRLGPGTVVAEGSILGVITLGRRTKMFPKLLLPDYCFIDTYEQGITKIKEMESNPELKYQVSQAIQDNLKKIDYRNLINNLKGGLNVS